MNHSKNTFRSMCASGILALGCAYSGASIGGVAQSCDVSDVTIGGSNAVACDVGADGNDNVSNGPVAWDVNDPFHNAGDVGGNDIFWSAFHKRNSGGSEETNLPDPGYNLQVNAFDEADTFSFDLGAGLYDVLIVLKDGKAPGGADYLYAWYLFEDMTGSLAGNYATANPFPGKDLSHLTVYTSPVPVPAAVWLFGSAIAGLGFVRRKSRS